MAPAVPASAVLSRPYRAAARLGRMTTHANGRIALITGANKGIGYATARELAEAGHTVLLGARDPGRGRTAAGELTGQGLDVRYVRLDVTDPETIAAAVALVEEEYGRLDILVNNAAISRDRPYRPDELSVEMLREVYETNVFGVVAVTNAMLPLLRRSPAGYVGNVSSGLGTVAFLTDLDSPMREYANLLAYNSSKAALNAITLIYAAALRGSGIRVNALSPGFCATDLNGHIGTLTAAEGGAHIAQQVTAPPDGATGVFLSDTGGTYPW
jgi:NAD(P)-dependent dehydrogenase (short-subunit alcohol dehydrogenase family)